MQCVGLMQGLRFRAVGVGFGVLQSGSRVQGSVFQGAALGVPRGVLSFPSLRGSWFEFRVQALRAWV